MLCTLIQPVGAVSAKHYGTWERAIGPPCRPPEETHRGGDISGSLAVLEGGSVHPVDCVAKH